MAGRDIDLLARRIVALERQQSATSRATQLTLSSVRLLDGSSVAISGGLEGAEGNTEDLGILNDYTNDIAGSLDEAIDFNDNVYDWIGSSAEAGEIAWDATEYAVDLANQLEVDLAAANVVLDQARQDLDAAELELEQAQIDLTQALADSSTALQEAQGAVTAANSAQTAAGTAQSAADQAAADALAAANAASAAASAASAAQSTADTARTEATNKAADAETAAKAHADAQAEAARLAAIATASGDATAKANAAKAAAEVTAAADALTKANAAQAAAEAKAATAQSAAEAAQTTANAKGKVIIQSTAPAASDRLVQNLWIDTTGGLNTPKRWTTGTTWVAVTDKVATDAAAAAVTAQDRADEAYDEALSAATAAGNAQASADGKSTNWYQDEQPAGMGHQAGDTWFDTNDGNRIYRWNGSWVAAQFGTNAISDTAINAAKLANNAVTEGKILNGAISNDKLSTAVKNSITTAQSTADNAATAAANATTAASAAQGAANTAQDDATQAIADALAAANAVAAVQSRGNDLITNGNASLGSLNFSTFVLEKGDQPVGAQGAFWVGTNNQIAKLLDERIEVDPSKSYIASIAVKQTNPDVTMSRFYFGLAPLDAYGHSIQPGNYIERSGTRTALAEALKPGDTKIVLASASGWYQGDSAYLRQVSFWSYVDQSGKLWEPGTYTRLFSGSNTWDEGGISGNTITLRKPWTGDTFPAGTVVGNTLSGGTYMYAPGLNNTAVTGDWKTYTQTVPFTGVHTDNTLAATTRFPAATASVRVALLSNYSVSGGTSKQLFANVSLSDVAAAQTAASSAQTAASTADGKAVAAQNTANAKGKVIIQSAAPAAADRLVQNLWIDTTGGANTPKRWVSGTTWAVVTDKAATDAAAAAVTAKNAADAAQTRADDAHTIASGAATAASAAQSAASAAQTAANNAQTTADGKNKIVRSTADASSPGNYVAGDQWWKYNGSQITAMWIHSGSAWVSQTLTDSVITNLNAGSITAGTISAARLSATNIKAVLINAGAIETANIAAGAITAASGIIADLAIGTAKIIDGSITTAKIKELAVTNAEIANGTIQNAKIANLDAAKITTGYLAAARIEALSISAGKLAANAVTADKILAGAVVAGKLATNSVVADNIVGNTITGDKLVGLTITGDKIAANAITAEKIAADSISALHVEMDEGFANKFWANEANFGKIQVVMLEPDFGDTINIAGNVTITGIQEAQSESTTAISDVQEALEGVATEFETTNTLIDNALAAADIADGKALVAQDVAADALSQLGDHQSVFRVTSVGAEIATVGGEKALRLEPDGVSMLDQGVVVTRWENTRMIVNEAVLNQAQLANHSIRKHGTNRTIIQPLS